MHMSCTVPVGQIRVPGIFHLLVQMWYNGWSNGPHCLYFNYSSVIWYESITEVL